jgi:hypothetical protein
MTKNLGLIQAIFRVIYRKCGPDWETLALMKNFGGQISYKNHRSKDS